MATTKQSSATPDAAKKIEFFSGAYFGACTIGGIIACGPTHTAVTPLDLVKCRRQVDPKIYSSNFQAWGKIMRSEGLRGVFFGGAPTFIGYSFQGAGKYGAYESLQVLLRRDIRGFGPVARAHTLLLAGCTEIAEEQAHSKAVTDYCCDSP